MQPINFKALHRLVPMVLLSLSALLVTALGQDAAGWLVFVVGLIFTASQGKLVTKQLLVAYLGGFLLMSAPISTDATKPGSGILMMFWLIAAVVLPYVLDRYIFKTKLIRYKWHSKLNRNWRVFGIPAIAIFVVFSYFLLPFYFHDTGSYLNWTVDDTVSSFVFLFFGAFFVGAWDELFFINTIYTVFRKRTHWLVANGLQAVIFSSFLWEVGFRSWAIFVLYPFALMQGFIYRKTESLIFVIVTHLILDLLLVGVLINSHYPSRLQSFFV